MECDYVYEDLESSLPLQYMHVQDAHGRSRWPRGLKAWTVFARSNTGLVGSNPTQGIDVYVRLFCVCVVLCVGSGLGTGWSLVQGVLQTVQKYKKIEEEARPNKKAIEPFRNEWMNVRMNKMPT
jgi:hypothetical protein